ncbi:MAG: EF-P beta-lysylation protein EpmB, partial [Lysobacterales bacterium]
THKLAELTDALRELPQIATLRIHTRLPVVLPARVDAEFATWLERLDCSKVIVIHANHAQEFDAGVDSALRDLRDAGCVLLNQSVLLRGVNDSVAALADLSRRLLRSGVTPYYLHALDAVAGAAHFAVDDARAIWLINELRQQLPGYLVPRLVREVAGAASKIPLVVRTHALN